MTTLTVDLGSTRRTPDLVVAAKLEAFTRLSADDRAALAQVSRNVRFVEPRRDLISEGDRPRYVHLMLDGWACRYKQLPDGKRQIVSLFVPGDFCDVNVYILRSMDHSIGAITRLKVAMITPDEMNALTATRPRITQGLWWHELVTSAIQREWTLNLGQRSAYERLAHLLIELYMRLNTVGRAQHGRCDFPLTQNDLADATGLTAVHVNRTLQELRRDGLIELDRKQLQILDLERMVDVSMFNANYLHLDREGRHLDANE
ncbi:MAG TPA: Crp/Fnr family transcriptional regulator [Sphingomicrobium sp.]|nr:Crp/Fnr family transcriptional regulator [Sphingomicrobium sp.]